MELELTFPRELSTTQARTLGLRAVDAPLAGTTKTWAMDLAQEDLPMPSPSCRIMGFWNDIPKEEQRDVVELMPPTYGKKNGQVNEAHVDVKEMAMVLIGIYLIMALIHLMIMIVQL
jgi:hypothetical protein